MKLIDADALEELFRELITAVAHADDLKKDREYIIRSSAVIIEMINDAPAIEVGNMWIPVSEKLPDHDSDVLVTVRGEPEEIDDYVSIDHMSNGEFSEGTWFTNDDNVKAWMPLPQPYERKEE